MTNQRLGEANGRAKLTDAEVDELRTLREEEVIIPGKQRKWSHARLAKRFGISKSQAIRICLYRHRHGVPDER